MPPRSSRSSTPWSSVSAAAAAAGCSSSRACVAADQDVTVDDVYRCLNTYVLPLFDAGTSVCAVATAPSNLASIEERLSNAGYELEHVVMPGAAGDDASGSESESDSGDSS